MAKEEAQAPDIVTIPLWVRAQDLPTHTPFSKVFWARLRAADQGPTPYYIGRSVYYRMDDVNAWLDSRPRRGGSDAAA